MKEVIFKSEIPISTNNERIFDRTFVIEQWFRRIVSSAIKLQYGSNWMDFLITKMSKHSIEKRVGSIENRCWSMMVPI